MAKVILRVREDETIYLQCCCGSDPGRPCSYRGEITGPVRGTTMLRQAHSEAFSHCWAEHRIPAWRVEFEIHRPEVQREEDLPTFLDVEGAEPQKVVMLRAKARQK